MQPAIYFGPRKRPAEWDPSVLVFSHDSTAGKQDTSSGGRQYTSHRGLQENMYPRGEGTPQGVVVALISQLCCPCQLTACDLRQVTYSSMSRVLVCVRNSASGAPSFHTADSFIAGCGRTCLPPCSVGVGAQWPVSLVEIGACSWRDFISEDEGRVLEAGKPEVSSGFYMYL